MSDDNLQVVRSEYLGEQKSIAVSQLVDGSICKQPAAIRRSMNLPEIGQVPLLKVYGFARELTEEKELKSDDGRPPRKTWGLKGEFEAQNLLTGEVIVGSEYYMPDGFHERRLVDLRRQLAEAKGKPVEVELVHVWASFQTKSQAGYSWRLFDLSEKPVVDRLAATRVKALNFSTQQLMLTLTNGISPDGIVIEQKPQHVIDAAE